MAELGIAENEEYLVHRIKTWFTMASTLSYSSTLSRLLAELRRRAYRLANVSNGSYQAENSQKLDIEPFFEMIIGSIYVGYVKPMPEIYHLALDALDIEPSETEMVGDNYDRGRRGRWD